MGDFNIDMKKQKLGYDKLDEFCDLFNLTNLIKSETCFTKNHKSLIDLFLTNTPLSFQKTHVSETGLSDYHKLITTFFKTNFSRLRPKVLSYRNYKNFIESKFLGRFRLVIIYVNIYALLLYYDRHQIKLKNKTKVNRASK